MRTTLTALFIISFSVCRGQFLSDTAAERMAADHAVGGYLDFVGPDSRIYNGAEQIGYLPLVGHPYFIDEGIQAGDIVYEGVLYRNVPMLYDLIKDHLIIANSTYDMIILSSPRVSSFNLYGHHFIRTPNGFEDVLITGPLTIRARRTKRIEESIVDLHVIRTVYQEDHYSAVIDGVGHPFGNLKSLLRLVKSRKKEIERYLRSKKIKYKKTPELAITEAANYYNDHYPKAN